MSSQEITAQVVKKLYSDSVVSGWLSFQSDL